MLDSFEVITSSGVVLWSRTYTSVSPHVVDSLIKDVFIEEKKVLPTSSDGIDALPEYRKDPYSVKWSIAKDLQIIFVVSLVARVDSQTFLTGVNDN